MNKNFYLSGELAATADISTDTLRHYERKGVLKRPQRAPNGYRRYSADSVERLKIIRSALRVGFTLDELARVFAERDKGSVPCREVRQLISEKIIETEARLTELLKLREELQSLGKSWDKRLNMTAKGDRAFLLETLTVDKKENEENYQNSSVKFKKRKNQK